MLFELAQSFHDAIVMMPQEHPKHHMLELLEEAIRRDIHFIDRHPTTLFQCMWNTCRWRELPALSDLMEMLETWSVRREGPSVWCRAEAALPDCRSRTMRVTEIGQPALAQAYHRSRHLLTVARQDGSAEIIQLPYGGVVFSAILGAKDIESIAFVPDSLSLAYRQVDGGIALQEGTAVLRGRPGDRPFLLRNDHSVILTSEDGDLICWNPDSQQVSTLAAGIPCPLRVLRESEESGKILFVAGGSEQQIGVCVPVAGGWCLQIISCSGAEVVDADFAREGKRLRVVLLRKDRSVSVIDPEDGSEMAKVHYQRRNRLLAGAPQRVLGRSDAIYFVTVYGRVGRWNWRADELTCVAKMFEKTEAPPVVLFEDTGAPDTILLSTYREAMLVDVSGTEEDVERAAKHDGRTACCVIQRSSNLVVSASQDENVLQCYTQALKPCGRHAFPEPTSIALKGDSDAQEVVIGNRNGYLTTLRLGAASCTPGQKLSAERIVGIVPFDKDHFLVADRSGRRFWFPGPVVEQPLRTRRQIKIARAESPGIAYSLYEQGGQWTVERIARCGTEDTVLTSSARLLDIATYEDGRQFCLAGEVLSVHSPGSRAAITGNVALGAKLVAFVNREYLCVVLVEDDTCLEIRRIVPQLPVVATICLGHTIACIGTDGAAMVVGLESGHICSLMICDGSEPIQEERND